MTTTPLHSAHAAGRTTMCSAVRRAAFVAVRRRRAVGFVTCLVASVLVAGPALADNGAPAVDGDESSDVADVETGSASSGERLFDFDTATGTIIDTATGETVGIYDGEVRQFLSPDGSELVAIVDPANGAVTVVATGDLVARVQFSADNSAPSSTPSDAVDSDDEDGAGSDSDGITSVVAYAMIAVAGVLVIGLVAAAVRGRRRPVRGAVEPPVVAPRVDGATLPPPSPPVAATHVVDPDITPPAGIPSTGDDPTST